MGEIYENPKYLCYLTSSQRVEYLFIFQTKEQWLFHILPVEFFIQWKVQLVIIKQTESMSLQKNKRKTAKEGDGTKGRVGKQHHYVLKALSTKYVNFTLFTQI